MRSIHSQGFESLEHIVIDGGSTDGSVDVIRAYADRLAYWCSEPDQGHAHALSKGFARATGDVVTWVCSNDLLLPDSLNRVADCFASRDDLGWIVGDGLVIDEDSRVLAHIWALPFTRRSILYWLPWGAVQPSVFIRRSLFEAAGGVDPKRNVSTDTDLFLRLVSIVKPAKVNAYLGALRFHRDSQTFRKASEIKRVDDEIRSAHGMRQFPAWLRWGVFRLYNDRFRCYQCIREFFDHKREYPIGSRVSI